MSRNSNLLQARDQYVKDRFRYHRKRNPKWTIEAVLEMVSLETFLSTVTIVKILKKKQESVPAAATMSRYNKRQLAAA